MDRVVVAKEAYGYFIMSSLAIFIALIGLFLIYLERRKPNDQRNVAMIILGICISAAGSFLMLLTIFFLMAKQH